MPTRSIPADCARAASGQAATPPRRVMNSRRLILAQGVALREFYLVLGLVTRKFGLNNGSDGMSALPPCVDGSELARTFLNVCSIGRCSHVFGLFARFT